MTKSKPFEILLWKNKVWESKVSNTGDLAIIRNTFRKLKEQLPGVRLHVLSDDPEYVSALYGVHAHPVSTLWDPRALVALVRRVDLVVLGGGTVLQDNYFAGIIPINLSVPMLARLFGKRIVCSAIGVGSDEEISALGRLLCRLAMPRFDAITVRDPESAEMIERWTKGAPPARLTNDIAVDLPPIPPARVQELLAEEGFAPGPNGTVAIAARKIFHHGRSPLYFLPSSLRVRLKLQTRASQQRLDEFKTTLAQFADHLADTYGVRVLFLPFYSAGGRVDSANRTTPTRHFSSGDDRFAAEIVARMARPDAAHVLHRNYTPEEMLGIIGSSAALVGVPYHSIVFAASQGVPMLGIHYVSKVERYLSILGLREFIVHASLEKGLLLGDLVEKFADLWSRREELRAHLLREHIRLTALADENIRVIREVLEAP